jgi:hypothetical protein
MLGDVITLVMMLVMVLFPALIPAGVTAFHGLAQFRRRRMQTRAERGRILTDVEPAPALA